MSWNRFQHHTISSFRYSSCQGHWVYAQHDEGWPGWKRGLRSRRWNPGHPPKEMNLFVSLEHLHPPNGFQKTLPPEAIATQHDTYEVSNPKKCRKLCKYPRANVCQNCCTRLAQTQPPRKLVKVALSNYQNVTVLDSKWEHLLNQGGFFIITASY